MYQSLQGFQRLSIRILGIGSTIALCMTLPLPPLAAQEVGVGFGDGEYRRCSEDLRDLGLAIDTVARACAETLRPRDISNCVVDIQENTALAVPNILDTCLQVRRPKELGECVEEIKDDLPTAADEGVLNTCRRAMLPKELSNCVVGIAEELSVELESDEILTICLENRESIGYR